MMRTMSPMRTKTLLLASFLFSVPVLSSPTISQGSFFIRGAEHLFRIGL